MKKILYFLGIMVFALASCSTDDIIDDPEDIDPPPTNTVDESFEIGSTDQAVNVSDDGLTASVTFGPEASSVKFTVKTELTWEMKVTSSDGDDDWCFFGYTEEPEGFVVRVNPYISEDSRKATLTLTASTGTTATVTVTQYGTDETILGVSSEIVYMPSLGGEATVSVESSEPKWDAYILKQDAEWLTMTTDLASNKILLSAEKNLMGEMLGATIRVVAGAGDNVATVDFDVYQHDDALVLEITIPYDNATFTVPVSGDVEMFVDMGEGDAPTRVKKTLTSASMVTHTYAKAGVYLLTISGRIEELSCTNVPEDQRLYITDIIQWGDLGYTSLEAAFRGTAIKSVPPKYDDYFRNVTNISRIFQDCKNLETVPADIFNDCEKVTSSFALFNGMDKMTEIPRGVLDYLVNATNMSSIFSGTSITEIPADLFVNNTACTNVGSLFDGCEKLKALPEKLFVENSGITSFQYSFRDCKSLTQIPVDLFSYIPNVTTFYGAFQGCTGLTALPEKLFENNGSATNMYHTFNGCTGLTTIPAGLLDPMSNVTSISYMFHGCTGLTSIPSGAFKNMGKVTNLSYLFYGCTGLKVFPADLFSNMSAVTNVTFMFSGCTGLETIEDGFFDSFTSTSITSCESLFEGCTSLKSVPVTLFDKMTRVYTFTKVFYNCASLEGESPYSMYGDTKVHIYERTASNGFRAITNYSNAFFGCTKLQDYPTILANYSNWI